jgi:hypothetical protein
MGCVLAATTVKLSVHPVDWSKQALYSDDTCVWISNLTAQVLAEEERVVLYAGVAYNFPLTE